MRGLVIQLLEEVGSQVQPSLLLVCQGLRLPHTGAVLAKEPEGHTDPRVRAYAEAQQGGGHLQICKNISVLSGEQLNILISHFTCLSWPERGGET